MDSSPPPAAIAAEGTLALDLNIVPKVEPKAEPVEEEPGAIGIANASLFCNPRAGDVVVAPDVDDGGREEPQPQPEPEPVPLQKISPKREEEDLFSEYYRLAQLFLSLTAQRQQQQQQQPRLGTSDSFCNGVCNPPPPPVTTSGETNMMNFGFGPLSEDRKKSIVPSQTGDSGGGALFPVKKRRKHIPRSAEMVRVSAISPVDQRYFRDLVRRTRATFESLRLLMLREEEKGLGLTSQNGKRVRPDLKAAAFMTTRNLWINRDKRIIGSIPGVYVGDVFFYRIELCVLGLHGQVQGGIDYVAASRTSNGEPIATSIVVSGGYEDDEDSGNMILYTGHGGRDHNLHKHSIDQKLEGGNLALERSMNYGIEIRVIRGFKFDGGPAGKVYVYDGLYRVVSYWQDVGKSGFVVYKYKLVRIAGQFEMGSVLLKFAEDLKEKLLKTRPGGYLSLDISNGKECLPVSLFNDIDDERDPVLFEYVACPVNPLSMLGQGEMNGLCGCQCTTNCTENCSCAMKNGGSFVYDAKGILLIGKPLIYECGTFCQCPPTCQNRVSQKGLRHRLEVFRSRETGWGVRSLDLIRAGSFICEYTGVVLTEQQTEVLSMNGDSLVYPSRFPYRWLEWGDVSHVDPEYPRPMVPPFPQLKFSLDVSRSRNVACYLSHSCSPNVFLQLVLYDHYDVSYPHLMIFAMENIPPFRELSIDYGIGDGWLVKASP